MSDTESDRPDVVDAELVEESPAGTPPATVGPPAPQAPQTDYTDAGVPTFDYVRDRIENKYGSAVGSTELAGIGGPETVASLDKKLADREQAGKDKLAEIRKAMRGE